MAMRYDRIVEVLCEKFDPIKMEVIDESAKHAGHSHRINGSGGGETHFSVVLISNAFIGLRRVDRSRAVHDALQAEFTTGLHALSLGLQTPDEAGVL
jgi:BolA protein